MKPTKLNLLFLFFCVFLLNAQERPPIKVFTTTDYQAETQNWSISQGSNKNIYVANNSGLLEYNGAIWRLYISPNRTIIRSVNVIGDLIYTGCNREFGYWKKNKFGSLDYTSLSTKLNIHFLEEEEFWNIISIDNYVLFQSFQRIYIVNVTNNTYSIIDSDESISKIFKIDKDIYFQKVKNGLYKIEKGASKLVSNDLVFKDNVIVNIFPFGSELLIITEDNGFYVFNNGKTEKWDVPDNDLVSKTNVFRAVQLKNKSFLLGTRSAGIIHLSPKGDIDYKLNTINGLSNNTIHGVYEDQDGNIWLAMDNGINCINFKSPFTIYSDDKNQIGTVYASAIASNNLYLGTNQGLYYRPLDHNGRFNFIEGTQGVVWSLTNINNQLFCGHDSGTFLINDAKAEKIVDVPGTWNIKPINDHVLLQGNYGGLYVLEKVNETWKLRNKIADYKLSSKFFELHGSNEVLVNHEYKGVFNVVLSEDFTKAVKVTKDSLISKEPYSSLIKYNNDILFASKEGVFKYIEKSKRFAKDTLLSKLINSREYTSGRLVISSDNNWLWSFSKKSINYLEPSQFGDAPIIKRVPYPQKIPHGQSGYENIIHISGQKYLIGNTSGYVVVDLENLYKKSNNLFLNAVTQYNKEGLPVLLNISEKGEFKNNENNVAFSYGIPEFSKFADVEFQYQLEGIYPKWSDWSSESSVNFRNLPFGEYTFNLRGRVGSKMSDDMVTYKFSIARPFFLSDTMIVIYILVIALFSLFMHNVYKWYYRKQRERLEQKNRLQLERKELHAKQQVMHINNEKLRQDIENKSRELGIATMSLIKKNEFLSSIKNELKKGPNTNQGIKGAIRMIDNNLNDSDDWHTFEEAFNNADKDFLKKLKSLHPSLTSNDLRLCAYLRLNLASKEIAPLLNISARSVEVKRYRLRKKLDLNHDASLSDYILEI